MFGSSRGGVRGGQDQFNWEDVKTDKQRENYLEGPRPHLVRQGPGGRRGPEPGRGAGGRAAGGAGGAHGGADFVEVCKREGGDHEEKGVDRLLGLGSSSGSAGRVALSREDKEAAKLGLSVFTHHRVESGRPGSSPASARKKPRSEEEKAESGPESHRKSKKEKKKKKKKKHKKEKKKDKAHRSRVTSPLPPASAGSGHRGHGSDSDGDSCPCSKKRRPHHSD
ncbi:multiple myeloma tumor-associated protein 2 isoform X2 [Leptonychotes weddellii]|uniref:Multiple myeloma tumor-associated protein 2 isoform X2 n=1 Tax=Leptonychotes weddellii TaxID=9713 RepID=A0A7F8RQX6_LEPWE|nr:multiple myeloma tumor-associated protein 2 isoform X2 [Leptonychotes weddellii]